MPGVWEFWIDVGGTFTDCIARSPENQLLTAKVLSSGITKGQVGEIVGTDRLIDETRSGDTDGFWDGYRIRFLDADGQTVHQGTVRSFSGGRSTLQIEQPLLARVESGMAYELDASEEAPILAIRKLLGLKRDAVIPRVSVKLGTTRGTNALLTRRGARTAFITTNGFADVLLIGNQDRPRLFDLAIQKPEPLFESVVEIDERLAADGSILRAPDRDVVRRQLEELHATGVESIAICLLHSFANAQHEQVVEDVARDVGFTEISTSSRLSPLIRIVSRGDTTVMDACLNPILRDYVRKLRNSLGDSDLRLMTSAGGLVDSDSFVGKDSILSGPAGGVIGFSRVAQQAGFGKSIGFDMGGTSTDVSRFDGRYELEFETQKAGVRIVSPMLAIETVAAGGGSICGFDGVKLHVGPQSAGADPGPACYGRGGPLTVTDVNVFLGRVLPEYFPFPLHLERVQSQLESLCDEIATSPLGQRYTPVELADGFRRIANANMVRAIRRISVAKGYDPADYVLVSFGGAGSQHACALARSLGTPRVLIHLYSGILSAYGIGLADVRRFAERSILAALTADELTHIETVFGELTAEARSDVEREGLASEQIEPPVRSLELRYRGTESSILILEPDDGDWRSAFEAQHEQLYGYRHATRSLEALVARVEVVGRMVDPPETLSERVSRTPEPSSVTTAWFDGAKLQCGVFLREHLRCGDEITGPAIVCEPTSTVVIDTDWVATVEPRGELLLTDRSRTCDTAGSPSSVRETVSFSEQASTAGQAGSGTRVSGAKADPVLLEIFNNLFASIAEQMGVTLQKTSFSTNVKERLDFSCAIFTPTGDLVVNAPHIPVHLGAMSETVKQLLVEIPEMAPGDVYVTNDPFRGGSHLPDVTVITPVHDASCGELIFLTASRAHHAEIGGIVPGSMPPFSKTLAEEGVLIRSFQLVAGGESREDELRNLLSSGPYPSRSVEDNLADVSAQVAANNVGVRQLRELVKRYSLSVVHAYMHHIQAAAAAKMRLALSRLDDGTYLRTDHLDDGAPISVAIEIRSESATVDFTGTGPVLDTNLNANRAIVTAAVLYVFRCLIDEDIPLNSGVLEPVEIVLPECLLNPPSHDDPADCVAIVGGNVETSQRVVDVLLGALELAAASQGTMNNLTFGDGTFGYYETICGGSGATPAAAGADAVHTHMTNTRLTDAEVIERRYPVRLHEFSIRRGSGGTGQHRGGDGIVRRIEFLKPLTVSLLTQRRGGCAPFGLQGGADGAIGRNTLQRAGSDALEHLTGRERVDINAGDTLTIETPGGGGWGAGTGAETETIVDTPVVDGSSESATPVDVPGGIN
ncbi:MAG: hydantoinase B/oxoprolinase family protein [Planctomycetota bacterium]|jgi:5-oxoprolinase (ATP-hydrolysing)